MGLRGSVGAIGHREDAKRIAPLGHIEFQGSVMGTEKLDFSFCALGASAPGPAGCLILRQLLAELAKRAS